MQALMMYVLEVNLALLVFYPAYRFLLSNLTFYHVNRFFLLFAILFSIAYPLIDFSVPVTGHFVRQLGSPAHVRMVQIMSAHHGAPDYWLPLTWIFLGGVTLRAIRLWMQLMSLRQIFRHAQQAHDQEINFMATDGATAPFSFWRTIYVNPQNYGKTELAIILRHEWFHVHQLHTLDVLLAELLRMICWFNPASWLLSEAVKKNHEFIVDRRILDDGINRKAYQYLLLRVNGYEKAFTHAFGAPPLKERIARINKANSPGISSFAYMIIPVVLTALISFKIYAAAFSATNGERNLASLNSRKTNERHFQLDTIPGTLAMLHKMQLKTIKSNKAPLTEIILFTKNTQGVGMDLYVKFNNQKIENMKVLALAAPGSNAKQ
ncbi:hypothetical protein DYBT9275_00578 [Dyadobacter sp. CECT 9275]|uniref:Peptidase M56 domain-containing protein n=1 Tax=Dyadobacter helix TaxID=2822344 RepID=A0A916NAI3_9BACT|nr:M56 family metallopeptidase [Dyadobacter sp. CECT 9275]CAG4990643.1 hypothetical protein DYBT9275_00578 [Dyadobacter sp. CECT 9275]